MSVPAFPDQELLRIAYNHARRLGLEREEAQECALDFRLHLLRAENPRLDSPAWLHRCARNYALNYLRTQTRRQQREHRFAEQNHVMPSLLAEPVAFGPGPKTLTLRKALWEQVFATLKQFTPDQQELFVCYHVRQQTLAELSTATGRTVHALQQSLANLHRRLAQLLLQEGWSAGDARQLFGVSLPPSAPVPRAHS